jgi:hypothetical protein
LPGVSDIAIDANANCQKKPVPRIDSELPAGATEWLLPRNTS